jgi:hypothetical protein
MKKEHFATYCKISFTEKSVKMWGTSQYRGKGDSGKTFKANAATKNSFFGIAEP